MPQLAESIVSLRDALDIHGTIAEYSYLETDVEVRELERQLFTTDQKRVPRYTYPKLMRFLRQGELAGGVSYDAMRQNAVDAIRTLYAAAEDEVIDSRVAQLYIDSYASRIQRLLLLKTAQEMADPQPARKMAVLRHRFRRLNEAAYGALDEKLWLAILASERERLEAASMRGSVGGQIRDWLQQFYDSLPDAKPEQPLLDEDLCDTYREVINKRYASILRVIPATGDSIVYDAHQCAAIMKHALAVGGFRDWKAVVSSSKTTPSTDVNKREIALPSLDGRTANELKRLILHEQEVHARRWLNAGRYHEFSLLRCGTADYAAVEEGLGLFLEIMLSGSADSPAVHRARDRYIAAGLALGCSVSAPRDARQTYEPLWRMIAVRMSEDGVVTDQIIYKAKQLAYSHIENAFRGTDFKSKGVIYSKLKVYYEGLHHNVAYMRSIAANVERLDEAFIGKYNHTNVTERQLVLGVLTGEQSGRVLDKQGAFQVAI